MRERLFTTWAYAVYLPTNPCKPAHIVRAGSRAYVAECYPNALHIRRLPDSSEVSCG